jgi:8-oxo-dGTP diphosphatase
MLDGQRLQPDRYTVVPRTISFIFYQDQVLLIQVAEGRGAWSGQYNGVGGHIERGEDPLSSARRELKEETGVVPDQLHFCGHILIDTGKETGIGLFVFGGSIQHPAPLKSTIEGTPQWLNPDELKEVHLVEDLHWLLPKVRATMDGAPPFLGLYQFDDSGKLVTTWAV